MTISFVSETCEGEVCWCEKPAVRKVGEEFAYDEPNPDRHNLTRYICAHHFAELMGPAGARSVGIAPVTPAPEGEAWRHVSQEEVAQAAKFASTNLASPVIPKTADEIKAVVMAWLDADDPASWGDFEKRLNAAVSDDASPVVPVGREEIARIIEFAITVYEEDPRTDFRAAKKNAVGKAADAIIAALGTKATDTGREG